MVIGICDDNEEDRRKIFCICQEKLSTYQIEYDLVEFENGEAVLEYPDAIALLILDIEMPGLNGIELKEMLQSMNSKMFIIFVTGYDEYVMNSFGINVLGYIMKNVVNSRLPEMLESVLKLWSNNVLIDGRIDSREVLYIQSDHGYNRLVFANGKNELLRRSMEELERLLTPCGFLRVHRGYLVNMSRIEGMKDDELEIGGFRIPIAMRMRSNVKKSYAKYARENARYC